MKKFYYTIYSLLLILPFTVNATVTKPGSFGLAKDITDPNDIVEKVIKFVTGFLSSLAILMIVISGIMYMTSGGDQQKAETAKKLLTYSIIGLVVALLAYAIVMIVGRTLGAWN